MSRRIEPGVFLQKRSYRRRRLLDGIKILPLLGGWVFMLPVLWTGGTRSMSEALIYVFGAWIALIVLSFGLLRGYRRFGSAKDIQESAREGEVE